MESEDYIKHHKEKEARMVAWNVEELELELYKLRSAHDVLVEQLSDAVAEKERMEKIMFDAVDAADSLMKELDREKAECRALQATVDRLRLHIQQGVEL